MHGGHPFLTHRIAASNTMPRHWLMKSEPSVWSWAQQVEAGAKGTFWNGVRNHLAKQQLMAMKKGERGFFYHSNDERAIVGIVNLKIELASRNSIPNEVEEPCVDFGRRFTNSIASQFDEAVVPQDNGEFFVVDA